MYFKKQKFLVAGMSKSGESSARFLLKRGAKVYVYDDVVSEGIMTVMNELQNLGAIIVRADGLLHAAEECDVLVLSPGIPIDNPLPISFRRQGKAIYGEEELGALYLRATAVAVTGTNGKTTTVSIIDCILNAAKKYSVACGNIGKPLVGEVEELGFDDFAVIEISSFQLETLFSLKAHVAVITNITEDHLNRHYNMENYIYLKSRLIRSLKESEYAVLNYDDETVRSLASNTKAKVIYFSYRQKVDGAYYEDGYLCYNGERLFSTDEMLLSGVHNIYNVLASITVAKILGVENEVIKDAVCSFKGVKHRVENIGTFNGKCFIDDSKGTNIDATVKAVESMTGSTVLLLGGKDKGEDYTPLFDKIKECNVVHAVIYGENRFKMLNSAFKSGFVNVSMCSDFKTAVRLAEFIAKPGQCVLLSPASSSFDAFSNYEERGDAFVKLVEEFNANG